jgi:hypothetical protein
MGRDGDRRCLVGVGEGESRGRRKKREKENRRREKGGIRKSRERYHTHFLDLCCVYFLKKNTV